MENIAIKNDQSYELAAARAQIHELEEQMKRLKRSEDRYRYFFENSPIGIYRTTPDGRILLCNPKLLSMLGYDSFESIKNRNLEGEGSEPYYPRARFKELLKMQGEAEIAEAAWSKRDGSVIFVRERARAVKNKNGEIIYYEGRVEDITEHKRLQQAKEDFISTAAHELRTPLTSLQGYLSLLDKEHQKLADKEQTYINKLVKAGRRLNEIVEDLLSVIRLEHHPKINLAPFQIEPIIEEAVSEWMLKAKQENKALILETSSDYTIQGDPEYTKKIISNLVSNAVKYTENGGVIRITSSRLADDSQPMVLVSVQDNGVGIAKEHHNDIFTKFFRVPNPLSIKAGGTGLGLYIVRQLVELQNGRIWMQSERGTGSKFSFTLPLLEKSMQLPLLNSKFLNQ